MSHEFDVGGEPACPFMPVFGPPATMMERGDGTVLWDAAGKRYLDFLAGIAVVSVGHANPVVAEAVSEQARRLVHVSNFFANRPATDAALAINGALREATGYGGQVFFTNSGAEAVECAIKLARKHGGRGRHTIVSALGSFHGRTLAALAATGQPSKHEPFAPMPEGFRHVALNDADALSAAVDGSVGAVLLEPILGEGGVRPLTPEYLQHARTLCDEVGALLIIDEIQTGFGRTGTWFGFEQAAIRPDVVTLAKALGNGMPIGACWARTDVAAAFEPGDHGSTYSGTALATAAVNATLAELRRIDAPRAAQEKGERLAAGLAQLAGVVDVRGAGLLIAAVLQPGLEARAVAARAFELGLIVNAVAPDAIRLAPPLTVSNVEIDEALATLRSVLDEIVDGAAIGEAVSS